VTIYGVNQSQVQRYLTVANIRQARKYTTKKTIKINIFACFKKCVYLLMFSLYSAVWINLVGLVALISLCCYAGMVIFARYEDCDLLGAGVIQLLKSSINLAKIKYGKFECSLFLNRISYFHGSLWTHSETIPEFQDYLWPEFLAVL
jgi:hypothetical protein